MSDDEKVRWYEGDPDEPIVTWEHDCRGQKALCPPWTIRCSRCGAVKPGEHDGADPETCLHRVLREAPNGQLQCFSCESFCNRAILTVGRDYKWEIDPGHWVQEGPTRAPKPSEYVVEEVRKRNVFESVTREDVFIFGPIEPRLTDILNEELYRGRVERPQAPGDSED